MDYRYERKGEWMEIDPLTLVPASDNKPLEAGSHAHEVRQWLLACSVFPAKWINRLFSVGGIRMTDEGRVGLLAFPKTDVEQSNIYRVAAKETVHIAPPVLYEDDLCLVLDKPAGMPVHESYPGQGGTLDVAAARHLLGRCDPLPVRHIHRLDDDTSGPVLYATTDLGQHRLDEAMREKQIDRIYIAVVHGRLRDRKGVIDAPIGKDRHHKSRRRVSPGGENAVTRYERLFASDEFSVARVRLETGRTHQIRVHMSHLGHPLLGDALYGGRAAGGLYHQALHGEELMFPHPLSGIVLQVSSPWPAWLKRLYPG